MTGVGIAGDKKAQANSEIAVSSPLPINTLRNPKRRMTGVVTVFIPRLPAKTASTRSPDLNALSPKPIWNSSGKRKGITLIATAKEGTAPNRYRKGLNAQGRKTDQRSRVPAGMPDHQQPGQEAHGEQKDDRRARE